jgi:formate hydrogenlyase subunit 4
MGASREMAIAALAEPTVMIAIFAMALRAGTTGLNEMISYSAADPLLLLNPSYLLAFSSLFIVALAETGRLPVDNPSTHLELTMIHEAMILEYSGRYLALIEWAAAIKLFLFLTLLGNIFLPWGIARTLEPGALFASAVAFTLKLAVLAMGLALLETGVAKLRLFRVPALLSGSFALALLAVISFFFLR